MLNDFLTEMRTLSSSLNYRKCDIKTKQGKAALDGLLTFIRSQVDEALQTSGPDELRTLCGHLVANARD